MRGAATRKTHTKSRSGCQPCKKRHVRGDENKPKCFNCTRLNVTCVYQPPKSVPVSTTQFAPLSSVHQSSCPSITNSGSSSQDPDEHPSSMANATMIPSNEGGGTFSTKRPFGRYGSAISPTALTTLLSIGSQKQPEVTTAF